MRAERLYIIGINGSAPADFEQSETTVAARGLKEKYGKRSGTWKLVLFDASGNTPISEAGSGDKGEKFNLEVGCYFLMQGAAGGPKVATPEVVLNRMKTVFEHGQSTNNAGPPTAAAKELAKLGKISFLTCNLTDGMEKDRVIKVEEAAQAKERSFVLSLLLLLSDEGCHPGVAGWDDFISVAPYHGKGRSVYSAPGKRSNLNKLDDDALSKNSGKKIGSTTSQGLVDDAYRDAHKRTFCIKNGNVTVHKGKGWRPTSGGQIAPELKALQKKNSQGELLDWDDE